MDFLFQKIAEATLNAVLKVFYFGIENFVQNSAIFEISEMLRIVEFIQIIAALMMFYSVLSDIVYKMSGIEGSIYDVNLGEYFIKVFLNIIAIGVMPSIINLFAFFSREALRLVTVFGKQTFIIRRSGNILDSEISIESLGVGLVILIILILVMYFSIVSIYSLAKVQVEILIITIISPLALMDLYKSPDKIKSLIMNLIALTTTAGVKLILLYMAFKILGEIDFKADMQAGEMLSILKTIALLAVSQNPQGAVSFMLTPTKGEVGNLAQKGYYASQIIKGFSKKSK